MNKIVILLVLLCMIFFGCQTEVSKDTLIISAAASTQFVVRQLAEDFEKEHKISVEVIIGSSGKLTAQIINGAPFDVFISADTHNPEKLKKEGKILGKPFVYGKGIPVVWSLDSTLDLNNIPDALLSKHVKKMAVADTKNAPYGKQAVKYLKDIGIYNQIENKLVFGESISQVNEYILSGSVQIGFSAMSVLQYEKLNSSGIYVSLDSKYQIPQAMVFIKNGKNDEAKKLFQRFVQSEAGKNVLKKYGLL